MGSTADGRRSGLRDATRRAVRTEIATKAMTLFVEQGFEQTTVDQIADEVGMSARSVFRYFDTKEEMVVGNLMELGHEMAAELERRPARETPWTALRRALQISVNSIEGGDFGLRRAEMLAGTPALRVGMLKKQQQWQQLLIPHLAPRLPGPAASQDLRARALVACALACLDVATLEWTHSGGNGSLGDRIDLAISAVRAKPIRGG